MVRLRIVLLALSAVALSLACAIRLCCAQSHPGIPANPPPVTAATNFNNLWNEIAEYGAKYLQRDERGDVIAVLLREGHATDLHLKLVSVVPSIRELTLQDMSARPKLTRDGVMELRRLTNLVTLRVFCFRQLSNGVFAEICALKQLKRLELSETAPFQTSEYQCLTNLQNLEDMRISNCSGFGDEQVSVLTNLPHLHRLELYENGPYKNALGVLRGMRGLTNVVIIP